jgi:hypothetical protein
MYFLQVVALLKRPWRRSSVRWPFSKEGRSEFETLFIIKQSSGLIWKVAVFEGLLAGKKPAWRCPIISIFFGTQSYWLLGLDKLNSQITEEGRLWYASKLSGFVTLSYAGFSWSQPASDCTIDGLDTIGAGRCPDRLTAESTDFSGPGGF